MIARPWAEAWTRLWRSRPAAAALAVLGLLLIACALAPALRGAAGLPAVVADALAAGAASLALALGAGALAAAVGIAAGAASGYAAQHAGAAALRLAFGLGVVPLAAVLAALAVVAGPDAALLLGAAGAIGWVHTARVARTEAWRLNTRPFVDAARLASQPPAAIVWRHLVPNLLGAVLVAAVLAAAQALLVEALLTFLGALAAPAPTWGALLRAGAAAWEQAPAPLLAPAALLLAAFVSLTVIGHTLRGALRPPAR